MALRYGLAYSSVNVNYLADNQQFQVFYAGLRIPRLTLGCGVDSMFGLMFRLSSNRKSWNLQMMKWPLYNQQTIHVCIKRKLNILIDNSPPHLLEAIPKNGGLSRTAGFEKVTHIYFLNVPLHYKNKNPFSEWKYHPKTFLHWHSWIVKPLSIHPMCTSGGRGKWTNLRKIWI